MAELPPSWMAGCYTPQGDRLFIANLVGEEGVADVNGGSLLVTTGGSGLNLSVAQGGCFVEGDDDDRGMYSCYNDAAVTVTATAADPTNPRIDTVIARVYDSAYGEGSDEWVLEVLAGTPTGGASLTNLNGAGSTTGINALVLAYVLVPATFVGPFVNATHIRDARVPYQTNNTDRWHTVGATNEPAFANTWVSDTASGFQPVQYRRINDVVEIRGAAESGTSVSTIFTLPVGYRPPDDLNFVQPSTGTGAAVINVSPAGVVATGGYIGAGANTNVGLNFRFSVTT